MTLPRLINSLFLRSQAISFLMSSHSSIGITLFFPQKCNMYVCLGMHRGILFNFNWFFWWIVCQCILYYISAHLRRPFKWIFANRRIGWQGNNRMTFAAKRKIASRIKSKPAILCLTAEALLYVWCPEKNVSLKRKYRESVYCKKWKGILVNYPTIGHPAQRKSIELLYGIPSKARKH